MVSGPAPTEPDTAATLPAARVGRDELAALPDSPGVYFFYDRAGELLYIGKAVRLRPRVRSYFQPHAKLSRRRRALARRVVEIGYRPLGSELAALLTESRLIKQWQPKYNVQLKHLRNLYFLRLDPADLFPRLELTNVPCDDGADYFGPFRGWEAGQAAHDACGVVFRLRPCEGKLVPRRDHPGCLSSRLGRCLSPCDLSVSAKAYGAAAQALHDWLSSPPEVLLKRLALDRDRAAESLRFEEAAVLRDGLEAMAEVLSRRELVNTATAEHRAVVVQPGLTPACRELFWIEGGRLRHQQSVPLDPLPTAELRDRLSTTFAPRPNRGQPLQAWELDELYIVSTWLGRQREQSAFVPVGREFDPDERLAALVTAMG